MSEPNEFIQMDGESVTPKTSTRRKKTDEEKVEEIDKKIARYEDLIAGLKAKREEILNPLTYQDVMRAAKEQKISPKKLADAIGLKLQSKKEKPEPSNESEESED